MNIRALVFAILAFSVPAVYAADEVKLESVRASDLIQAAQVPGAEQPPLPVTPLMAEPVSPDLLAKFSDVEKQLQRLSNDLAWVSNDLNDLERRARQIIQYNTSDAFFQNDMRRMSSDMSRRFDTARRLSLDVKNLLGLAQSSQELNASARKMEASAREILRLTWPAMEDAAGRLEGTIRSGNPQVIGYDSQWTAGDISRYTRQISDQARYLAADTKNLSAATQP